MVQLGSISTIMQEEQSVSMVEKTVRSLKGIPNMRTLRLDQPFIVNKKLEGKKSYDDSSDFKHSVAD